MNKNDELKEARKRFMEVIKENETEKFEIHNSQFYNNLSNFLMEEQIKISDKRDELVEERDYLESDTTKLNKDYQSRNKEFMSNFEK